TSHIVPQMIRIENVILKNYYKFGVFVSKKINKKAEKSSKKVRFCVLRINKIKGYGELLSNGKNYELGIVPALKLFSKKIQNTCLMPGLNPNFRFLTPGLFPGVYGNLLNSLNKALNMKVMRRLLPLNLRIKNYVSKKIKYQRFLKNLIHQSTKKINGSFCIHNFSFSKSVQNVQKTIFLLLCSSCSITLTITSSNCSINASSTNTSPTSSCSTDAWTSVGSTLWIAWIPILHWFNQKNYFQVLDKVNRTVAVKELTELSEDLSGLDCLFSELNSSFCHSHCMDIYFSVYLIRTLLQAQYLLLIIFAPHLSHNFSSACMFETILSLLDTFSSIGLLASSSSESMPFGAKFDDRVSFVLLCFLNLTCSSIKKEYYYNSKNNCCFQLTEQVSLIGQLLTNNLKNSISGRTILELEPS
ncbi:hypothetical protein BpHYR1_033306, partial [Brachionus plicatilis]